MSLCALAFPEKELPVSVASVVFPQRIAANFPGSCPNSEPAFCIFLWVTFSTLVASSTVWRPHASQIFPELQTKIHRPMPDLSTWTEFPRFPSFSPQTQHDPRNTHHPPHLHLDPSFWLLGKWHQLTRSSNLKMSKSLTSPFLPVTSWSSKSIDSTQLPSLQSASLS